MPDRRAAILARCDVLDRLAEDAAAWSDPDGETWHAVGLGCVAGSGLGPKERALIHEFGPDAVRGLTAGARKMCEIHKSEVLIYKGMVIKPRPGSDPDGEDCEGCGYAEGAEWLRNTIGECPSLAATELMLGLGDDD